ncbi:hypothetical protein [Actinokineospora bangkokensis]|uniref:Chromosome partitioning protein n=1 Tax=Actinokineospora bangkokensis TaxID=1193682 RepID=A0A1Q9LP24_9PSEU|nr:hypothetical protein [Actinokineospora bangkokensis]OLR93765.1 hypothetical protein BJP25_16085 [Actinokineospora bangkokensis]
MGVEVVVGMLIAWVAAKARRAAQRADGVVDDAIDKGVEKVGELVLGKLGGDSAVEQLQLEAAGGEDRVDELTKQRVDLSLQAACKSDPEFAARLAEAVEQARDELRDNRVVQQSVSGTVLGKVTQIGGDVHGDISF